MRRYDQGDRKNWGDWIGDFVDKRREVGDEFMMAEHVTQWLEAHRAKTGKPEGHRLLVEALNKSKEKRNAFDAELVAEAFKGGKLLRKNTGVRLELEGSMIPYWTGTISEIRHKWNRGLSILARKDHKQKKWDAILKYSSNLKSFWLITFDLFQQGFDEEWMRYDSHVDNSFSRQGKDTCNAMYAVPWPKADEFLSSGDMGFCVDDRTHLCEILIEMTGGKV